MSCFPLCICAFVFILLFQFSSVQFSSFQFISVTQSCLTLCDPMNRSMPSLPVHHQLLEFTQTHICWVCDAIQLSHPLLSPIYRWGIWGFSSVQSLSRVWLFAIPWIAARQASLSITNSQSSLKLMSIESVMPSNHLILCHPLLLPPSIFSQHQGLYKWVSSSHQMAKVLELQHQSFQWIFRTDFL